VSKHRRRAADRRLDQPTHAVLGVAISEHAAGMVVVRRGDGVPVVRDAMSCPDSAHLLAVLAAVQVQRRSALERGYDITVIAFTWTPNVDGRALQLAEWLTTLKGPEVVTVEYSDAAGVFRGEHESRHGAGLTSANDRTCGVSQENWSTATNGDPDREHPQSLAATRKNARPQLGGVTVMASAVEIDTHNNMVSAAGLGTSTAVSPAEDDLALARGAAQVAMRSSAPQRPRPPRGRTLVRAAAFTASLAGVLGILTAALLRLIAVSTPAPTPVLPGTDGHLGTDTPDTSSSAAQPPGSTPTRAAGSSPSAINVAQSTQAHYLQAPESPAGPSTSAPLTLPTATTAPEPPQDATQPAIGPPDMPDTANTGAPSPPPADTSASQAEPLPSSAQPDSSDAAPRPPPAGDSAPPATPPPSAGDSAPTGTP
jgi:hypothetical protein